MNKHKNYKSSRKIVVEIFGEFINLAVGNVYNKIGLSLLLLAISLALFFSPIQNVEIKPNGFYIFGVILLSISAVLIFKRFHEIKKTIEEQDEIIVNMQTEIQNVYKEKLGKNIPDEVFEKMKIKYSSCIGLESILDNINSIDKENLEKYIRNI